ncbi:UDP-glucuronosyl/UDP-glucosyltransferase [Parasponia andersonii]|uniref:UDP-glucuronosyl/UDP-glucosyltransferase n=1 Tax=Parasponia andersonii TaxID=3476 RepID=A0A2P5AW25_PARAD|nr:UDP-glucuronosyl/UDP-glucosyltransferase [Parasponia andersonii]
MSTTKPRVLVVPVPAQGHVKPLMLFSHKLAKHGFRITFVNTEFNHKRILSAMNDDEGSEKGFVPDIELVSIPDGLGPENDRTDAIELARLTLETIPAEIEKLITTINGGDDGGVSESSDDDKIRCVVSDVHMSWIMEVAAKMGVKGAVFCPSSAALSVYTINIPKMLHDGILDPDGKPTKKQMIQLATGMPAMDTSKFPWNFGDLASQKMMFHHYFRTGQGLKMANWWLCNTAYEIEYVALSLLPRLIPIGPLMKNDSHSSVDISGSQFWPEDSSCLNWLNQHKPRSVIYIDFGSFAVHDEAQLRELALGLELTGRPFLWVVRPGFISNEENSSFNPYEFLGNNSKYLGKIVSWAPQQKVLAHPSIACFVSHCGWNSTMEGLSNGVPFLCWPYFADQNLDKSYICDVWKVGMGFEPNVNGIISSEEVKNKVDKLLSDGDIRRRSLELKEIVMKNIAKDGQSSKNFNSFIKWLEEA